MKARTIRAKVWLRGDLTGCIIEAGMRGEILERIGYHFLVAFQGQRSVFRVPVNSPLVEVLDGG